MSNDKLEFEFAGVTCSKEEFHYLDGFLHKGCGSSRVEKELNHYRLGKAALEPEFTGGSSSYYQIQIKNPTTKANPPYLAECNDIIEALNMNYAEASAFKAIWRKAAAELGKLKKGYDNGLYDSEKVVFFGERMVIQAINKETK